MIIPSELFFANEVSERINTLETLGIDDVDRLILECVKHNRDPSMMIISHTDFNTFGDTRPCIIVYSVEKILQAINNLSDISQQFPEKMFGAFFGNLLSGNKIDLLKKMYSSNILSNSIWTAYNFEKMNDDGLSVEFKKFLKKNTPRIYVDNIMYTCPPSEIEEFLYTKHTNYILDTNGFDGDMFKKCAINVLVDTCASNLTSRYTTLKVFKPIKYKKPFITTFGKDSLKFLKKIGFKTFDTCWDEGYDDYYPGDVQFDRMISSMKEIIEYKNIATVVSETASICEYNYNLLHDTDWNNWFVNTIREKYYDRQIR